MGPMGSYALRTMCRVIGFSVLGGLLLVGQHSGAEEEKTVEVTVEVHGLEKICGVWEMTVHNMLNHREYQYALHVPPNPELGPVPSKLIVNGQTVYIRWEFPGGFSEESLLLRRGGKVMEGTFTNFAGARGGVSGKLIRPCVSE